MAGHEVDLVSNVFADEEHEKKYELSNALPQIFRKGYNLKWLFSTSSSPSAHGYAPPPPDTHTLKRCYTVFSTEGEVPTPLSRLVNLVYEPHFLMS